MIAYAVFAGFLVGSLVGFLVGLVAGRSPGEPCRERSGEPVDVTNGGARGAGA